MPLSTPRALRTLAGLALGPALVLPAAGQGPAAPAPAAEVAAVLEPMTVLGTPERRERLAGSTAEVDAETLQKAHVQTTNEALRKLPGVHVRDEEGFGLRPNIGIRGLNPTRSTKVLLLEDGIPLAYAPYGDNASYYHPPVERFDRIELLKGSGVNLYGPQTIGGVINYRTPEPTEEAQGLFSFTRGERDYLNVHARAGAENLLVDYLLKRGDGARDNLYSELDDFNLKGLFPLAEGHRLVARINSYHEDSQVTYSGLTDAEFAAFGPLYNPFKNDVFDAKRVGASLTHEWRVSEALTLSTNLYGARFSRDWWRQSSTTADGQCNATTYTVNGQSLTFQQAREAGFAVDPDDCNSVQGRLRDYYTTGIEPRLRLEHASLGLDNELIVGLRLHREEQERLQVNGSSPTARSGTLAEDNARDTEALALFVQNRFGFGRFALTPGLRLERIDYTRTNRPNNASAETSLDELIPSLGATYALSPRTTLFAGVHKGFAPPRAEDIIGQSGPLGSAQPTVVEVEAEESTNAELGLRSRPLTGLSLEATLFRNDFERQIVVGSVALGNLPLAVGEALHQGAELSGRFDLGRLLDSAHNPFLQLAWTWVETAEARTAFRQVSNGAAVGNSRPGARLPYAPEHLLTATLGYQHPQGLEARAEAVFVDEQFSDFGETVATDGSGRVGLIDDYLIWNLAVDYRLPDSRWAVFVAGKNVFDEVVIVDRTRGIQTAPPATLQGGVRFVF
ncbi:MAG TPA: TonB-dependent receptor [Nevskiaceae bacterium]|nr:TonB-dependent receptor [Nevskiaceae bacterium]